MDRRLVPAFAISPLRELARIENEINKFLKEFMPQEITTEVVAWKPRVDVYEKDNNIVVEAEIPGAKKEDIEVKIKDNAVVIRGEVKKEEEKKEENYYRSERFYGKFERVIPLPADVKVEEAKAEYQDGVLKLTIPKATSEKEIKIEVK
ncbi:Hsp20/alpha crystallin family protein [Sulfurihydrogenibium azorense]|jgi:HSP20 family protein|uniref:Small heat shock protein n=1 Tax=Sulfurihydrogenibium azorense (strain DSM 15241 / OCM 825 / Az-Fu1) TaxID=204536 RepID=C1DVH9_SULAA|nr:Hsp20/alpha crystallin family protein [Sulfurihydrogenibium azorense]ACN98431.1 small heat shock protein [Sulfurihydrogenibium azorense Az-Fu1]MDM7274108.1 Hsp20/alpha crystallin family protein [Sulfurihydrogenibium azorense]